MSYGDRRVESFGEVSPGEGHADGKEVPCVLIDPEAEEICEVRVAEIDVEVGQDRSGDADGERGDVVILVCGERGVKRCAINKGAKLQLQLCGEVELPKGPRGEAKADAMTDVW